MSNSMMQDEVRHTLSILVDDEPGVLARVIGLFSGRGYNIESLTVAGVDKQQQLSRISIVTRGTPLVIEQVKAQLDRIIPVHSVRDLTEQGRHIERELALIKISNTGEPRIEALRIADTFRASTLDSTLASFVFEITGSSSKITAFIELMRSLGEVEVSRTGVSAISRGSNIDMPIQHHIDMK
jgi:acetolactate synthase-1/3 small subunit